MLGMNPTASTALGGWVPPDIWLVTITHSKEVPRTELQVGAVNMNINETYISWVFTVAQPLDFIFLNLFIPIGVSVTSKREKIGTWRGRVLKTWAITVVCGPQRAIVYT